jgi:hypothetical protein
MLLGQSNMSSGYKLNSAQPIGEGEVVTTTEKSNKTHTHGTN